MSTTMEYSEGTGRIQLSDSDAAGGIISVKNPFGQDVYLDRILLDVTTKATTGTPAIDGGIAANGTTSSDNLIDGLDVGTAAGVFDNLKNGGTNGKAGQVWGKDQFLVFSRVSGAVAGLKGEAVVSCKRLTR